MSVHSHLIFIITLWGRQKRYNCLHIIYEKILSIREVKWLSQGEIFRNQEIIFGKLELTFCFPASVSLHFACIIIHVSVHGWVPLKHTFKDLPSFSAFPFCVLHIYSILPASTKHNVGIPTCTGWRPRVRLKSKGSLPPHP